MVQCHFLDINHIQGQVVALPNQKFNTVSQHIFLVAALNLVNAQIENDICTASGALKELILHKSTYLEQHEVRQEYNSSGYG